MKKIAVLFLTIIFWAPAGWSQVPGQPPMDMEPINLTADIMERFITATTKLSELGLETAASELSNPNDPEQMAELMQRGSKAMQIMADNGFDIMNFQQVAYTIGLAVGAVQMGENEVQMNMARQQLEAMKSTMSEEDYQQALQGMEGLQKMYADQPEGNVDLVKKYWDELMALGNAVAPAQ